MLDLAADPRLDAMRLLAAALRHLADVGNVLVDAEPAIAVDENAEEAVRVDARLAREGVDAQAGRPAALRWRTGVDGRDGRGQEGCGDRREPHVGSRSRHALLVLVFGPGSGLLVERRGGKYPIDWPTARDYSGVGAGRTDGSLVTNYSTTG